MDKERLLNMKIGEVASDLKKGNCLYEVHRVFGGWIYVFREAHYSQAAAIGLTSTFVPEQLNAEVRVGQIQEPVMAEGNGRKL